MDISSESLFVQGASLEVHEAEDGLIVFNKSTDKVHHLNPTSGVLFEICHQPLGLAAVAQQLMSLYGLDSPPTEEAEAGLTQLIAEGVLVLADGD